MNTLSIAIDGPAGAGKSTVAKKVAKALAFIYVDTGAMYRAIGLYCLEKGILPEDEARIASEIENVYISIEYMNGTQQVFMNGRNVTALIRTNDVSSMASNISIHPCVRKKLVDLQQSIAASSNVVMDGRDIGTFVIPYATLKIFLTASVEVRAKRRWQELHDRGYDQDIEDIKKEIAKRDYRDMNRTFAPLKKAEDAIEINSSEMTISQVINEILRLYYIKEGKYGNHIS